MTGSVSVTGTPIVGYTLSAVVNDPTNPNAKYIYQWYSNNSSTTSGGTAISGATSSTYSISSSMAGKYIYVVVTSSKGGTMSNITSAVVEEDDYDYVYNYVPKPTASEYCKSLTYNGNYQWITYSEGTGYTFYNNYQKDAAGYEITASLDSDYLWSDGTYYAQQITCSIK